MLAMRYRHIPDDPRYTADGVSPLLVEIRRERRIELFMEGFRYDDLHRWAQGERAGAEGTTACDGMTPINRVSIRQAR
ncbi:MAG: RagB/SusD family nutrient uptake outer membrane protein [Cyclobacteriaceae bacterium]|nr:RagB/SusD family nutrient uptake outer membrane protein [Cyclobacteriaceae bacterium]